MTFPKYISKADKTRSKIIPLRCDKKSDFFIDSYLKINSIDADWNGLKDLNDLNFNDKLTITHDSVITLVWKKIIKEDVSVEIKNEETDIIFLSFRCSDEKFAKFFSMLKRQIK